MNNALVLFILSFVFGTGAVADSTINFNTLLVSYEAAAPTTFTKARGVYLGGCFDFDSINNIHDSVLIVEGDESSPQIIEGYWEGLKTWALKNISENTDWRDWLGHLLLRRVSTLSPNYTSATSAPLSTIFAKNHLIEVRQVGKILYTAHSYKGSIELKMPIRNLDRISTILPGQVWFVCIYGNKLL